MAPPAEDQSIEEAKQSIGYGIEIIRIADRNSFLLKAMDPVV